MIKLNHYFAKSDRVFEKLTINVQQLKYNFVIQA